MNVKVIVTPTILRRRVLNYALVLLFMIAIDSLEWVNNRNINSFFALAAAAAAEEEEDVNVNVNVNVNLTGSWQNCTGSSKVKTSDDQRLLQMQSGQSQSQSQSQDPHPDSGAITISCTQINYRVSRKSINKINKGEVRKEPIVIGVLSGAGGNGPSKRNSIRSTWAYRKQNVFFIVAGPWEQIEHEYNRFHDLLWIDREEVYVTETSVLTFKTESFVAVMYNEFMKGKGGNVDGGGSGSGSDSSTVSYLFKADDDSYVDLQKLYRALLIESKKYDHLWDYWGKCNDGGWKPHRDKSNKWYISREGEEGCTCTLHCKTNFYSHIFRVFAIFK